MAEDELPGGRNETARDAPSGSQSPVAGRGAGGLRRLRSFVRFEIFLPLRRLLTWPRFVELSPLVLLAAAYVMIILFWTHGRLLFGQDVAGIYNTYDWSGSIGGLAEVTVLALCASNVYLAFYVTTFLLALGCATAMYALARIFTRPLSRTTSRCVAYVSAMLLLFNPWATESTFLSLISNVDIQRLGFLVFLVGSLLACERVARGQTVFRSGAMAGIGLGFALLPFPNYFRLWAAVVGIEAILFLASLWQVWHLRGFRWVLGKYLRFALLMTALAAALTALYIQPVLQDASAYVHLAQAGAADKSSLFFETGSFNVALNELRNFNGWEFPYVVYYSWYQGTSVLALASLGWPILALGVTTVLAPAEIRKRVLLVAGLLLAVIFYDKASNPPLGGAWIYVANNFRSSLQLFPTGVLSDLSLSIFYPVLCGLAICLAALRIPPAAAALVATLSRRVSSLRKPRSASTPEAMGPSRRHPHSRTVSLSALGTWGTGIFLAGLLVGSAFPVFDGFAETYSYNSDVQDGGFYIPQTYFNARALLRQMGGNVLLLPPTTSNPYVTTSWDWSGEIGFYPSFFLPVPIITLNSFGGTYADPSQWSEFENLTVPASCTAPGPCEVSRAYLRLLSNYSVSSLLLDSSINNGLEIPYSQSSALASAMIAQGLGRLAFSEPPLSIITLSPLPVYVNQARNSGHLTDPDTASEAHSLATPACSPAGPVLGGHSAPGASWGTRLSSVGVPSMAMPDPCWMARAASRGASSKPEL